MSLSLTSVGELAAEARRVREHAETPENYYWPGPGARAPSDDPRCVFHSGHYTFVFSLTVTATGMQRQLSVSTSKPGMIPQPIVVWTAADLLGFTGATAKAPTGAVTAPADDWLVHESAVGLVVQQPDPASVPLPANRKALRQLPRSERSRKAAKRRTGTS
ncbi:MAG TPA: hypothetical protein VMG12_36185 [Polyangiaceae bacterium]|nr:hypothetical protein [Polyangiaceae bacterium]